MEFTEIIKFLMFQKALTKKIKNSFQKKIKNKELQRLGVLELHVINLALLTKWVSRIMGLDED